MRELTRALLQLNVAVSHKAKSVSDLPPLYVLRSRTQRLSRWTASTIVGERDFKGAVRSCL